MSRTRAPATAPAFPMLVAMTGLALLTLNLIVPSLPAIAAEFDASYASVNLMVGGYLGVTALVQIVAGPLSDRVGRRPVVLVALAVFVAASLTCLLATSLWLLLAARMVQSAVVALSAMAMAILRDTHPADTAAARIATLGMAMAIAPMVGPVLGGALEATVGWRAGFAVYTGAGLTLLAVTWRSLDETHRPGTGGLGGIGRDIGALLNLPRFRGFAISAVFSVGAFFVFLAGAPLVASATFGLPPAALGVVLGSISAGFFCGSFVSSRIIARAGLVRLVLAGRVVACIGLTLGLIAYAAGLIGSLGYFAATITVGLGNGLTMPAVHSGLMSVRPDLAGSAAGLAGAMIVAGGAALSTATGLVLRAETAAPMLLALLLATCSVGLASALWLLQDERRILSRA